MLSNFVDDISRIELLDYLKDFISEFYSSYLVETVHGAFRIIRTLTYGEMLISFLLVLIFFLFLMKWIWEVLR